ncbi:MAG: phosphoribosylformylglycinamidine synthase I [Alphaproteobacteria bacterium]
MSIYVLTFPGSNCDKDAIKAAQFLGYNAHLLWHQETQIPSDAKLVIIPGGFSWGDYLRTGAISARAPIIEALKDYAHKGGYVLGICNGFQILCESGLLPGALLQNKGQDFIAHPCYLKVQDNSSKWLVKYPKDSIVNFPIAHHDGCFWADEHIIEEIEQNNQVMLRYCDADGNINDATNPNGSINNIAGICNKAGNVVGMMPHPERNVDTLISWGILAGSGKPLFQSIMEG